MASDDVRINKDEAYGAIPCPKDLHSFLHYFYFDDRDAAEAVQAMFASQSLSVKLDRSADDSAWGVYLTMQSVGTPERLDELTEGFERIAESFGGEYDGWELAEQ